jgi:signal transduction histidine kinase
VNDRKIEYYFLKNLLQIALLGVTIILVSDISLSFHNVSAVTIDTIILVTTLASFILLRSNKFTASVVTITTIPLLTMLYQAVTFGNNTIPLTAIIVIGFAFSMLLKGQLMWFMHTIAMAGIISVFYVQTFHPEAYMKQDANTVMATGITYTVLYILITFSAAKLKARYDSIHQELIIVNLQLTEKTKEIKEQNEELVRSQEKLSSLNQILEQSIEERTNRLIKQSEQLLNYSYVNAHHLRGPVARVLGLIHLSKIDPSVDLPFLFNKIEHETNEIDSIISRINTELEKAGKAEPVSKA